MGISSVYCESSSSSKHTNLPVEVDAAISSVQARETGPSGRSVIPIWQDTSRRAGVVVQERQGKDDAEASVVYVQGGGRPRKPCHNCIALVGGSNATLLTAQQHFRAKRTLTRRRLFPPAHRWTSLVGASS